MKHCQTILFILLLAGCAGPEIPIAPVQAPEAATSQNIDPSPVVYMASSQAQALLGVPEINTNVTAPGAHTNMMTVQWNRSCPLTGYYLSNYNVYDHKQTDLDCSYSNVYSVVIRSPCATKPRDQWEQVYITQGTNYSEPATNAAMFYTVFNSNIVNGDRGPY